MQVHDTWEFNVVSKVGLADSVEVELDDGNHPFSINLQPVESVEEDDYWYAILNDASNSLNILDVSVTYWFKLDYTLIDCSTTSFQFPLE